MTMGGSAWDQNRNRFDDNKDRSRWYGLRPGDEVMMRYGDNEWNGRVVRLHATDNNGFTLKLKATGKEIKGVCEWCTITKKVEDK